MLDADIDGVGAEELGGQHFALAIGGVGALAQKHLAGPVTGTGMPMGHQMGGERCAAPGFGPERAFEQGTLPAIVFGTAGGILQDPVRLACNRRLPPCNSIDRPHSLNGDGQILPDNCWKKIGQNKLPVNAFSA